MVCAASFAQTEEDFQNNGGTITGYTGRATTVVIPADIGGIPITNIGDEAFARKRLTSVTIPDGIVSIGRRAFFGNQLTSVTIPPGVFWIDDGAFANNPLTSITMPSRVSMSNAFPSSFTFYYDSPGRQAGTYVLNNGQWRIRQERQIEIDINPPKWILGTWVNTDWGEDRIIFEPENINCMDYDRVARIVEGNDLPDWLGEMFLAGTYYAIKIYSSIEDFSFHIYSDVREPLSPRIIEEDLPLFQNGEYLRKVNLFIYDDQWVFMIHYYRKIR